MDDYEGFYINSYGCGFALGFLDGSGWGCGSGYHQGSGFGEGRYDGSVTGNGRGEDAYSVNAIADIKLYREDV